MVSPDNKAHIVLFCTLFVVVIIIIGLVPDIQVSLYVILVPTIVIPLIIVVHRTLSGDIFTILTIYSFLFVWECFGYVLSEGLFGSSLVDDSFLIKKTFATLFIGYFLFLVGYFITYKIIFKKWSINFSKFFSIFSKSFSILTNKKWFYLFLLLVATTSMGFVKTFMRIRAGGGIGSYINTIYLYRFGTLAQDFVENAWIVLASNISSISLAVLSIAIIVCWKSRVSNIKKAVILIFLSLIVFQSFISTFRSTAIFAVMALIALYHSVHYIRFSRMIMIGLVVVVLLITLNYFHQYFYYSTAGWDYQDFTATLGRLATPQGHVKSLESVLSAEQHESYLYGKTLPDGIFFFIPRFLWQAKALKYGSLVVQEWAGLPTSYAIAVTNIGELIAHFGILGFLGMILHGMIHGYLETFRYRTIPLMAGYYCIVLPRLLVHIGVGLSALSITLFQLILLYIATKPLRIKNWQITEHNKKELKKASSTD